MFFSSCFTVLRGIVRQSHFKRRALPNGNHILFPNTSYFTYNQITQLLTVATLPSGDIRKIALIPILATRTRSEK